MNQQPPTLRLSGSSILGDLKIVLSETDGDLSISFSGSGTGWSTAGGTLTLQPKGQKFPVVYNFKVSFDDTTGQGYTLADPFGELTGGNSGFGIVLGGTSFSLYFNLPPAAPMADVPLNMNVIVKDNQGAPVFIDDPTIIFDAPPMT